MDYPVLTGALGGSVSVLAVRWLLGRTRQTLPSSEGSSKSLRYSAAYAAIGWAGLLCFATLAIGVSLSSEPPRVVSSCLAVFLPLALLSAFLVAMCHRCQLVYSEDHIRNTPFWGAPFTFTWTEVESVRFSGLAQWWRLRLRDGRTARVSPFMHGAPEFIKALEERESIDVPSAGMY